MNSHSVTRSRLPARPTAAPCATEANSSSSRATEPVMRTRAAPSRTNGSLAAASRIAWVAAAPGCSAP